MPKLSLKTRVERAYKELEKINAPVCHFGEGFGGGAFFAISAECNDKEIWADYYLMTDGGEPEGFEFGVNPKIIKVLNKYDLYAEWYNSAVLDVFEG